jgi:DNA polymerase-3 subunit delta
MARSYGLASMRLKPEQLASHLQKNLLPVYLLSGDEPLLIQEAADTLRSACRQQGFSERDVFHVEKSFNWENFLGASAEMSLFSDRKIIELRFNDKPDAAGSQAIQQYCDNPNPDNVLIISVGKLDKKTFESKWGTIVDTLGAIVQIWPIDAAQMPRWLDQRLKANGLNADHETLALLAERTQGNLLAAAQEIEKLKLFCSGKTLTNDIVSQVVADSARYDLFATLDDVISGKTTQALSALRGLRDEGTELTVIIWGVAKELRTLARIAEQLEHGASLDNALTQAKVWDKRKAVYQAAIRGRSLRFFQFLLGQTSQMDRQAKGMESGNPWDILEQVCLRLAR